MHIYGYEDGCPENNILGRTTVKSMMKALVLVVGLALSNWSMAAGFTEKVGIITSALTLCGEPTEACAQRTYRTSMWGGCSQDPMGCVPREFEMTLSKGDSVRVLAMDQSGTWLRVVAKWCVPTSRNCAEQFSGWVRRSAIAYLTDFKRLTPWPSEGEFLIEVGDYVETFKVRKDGTFSSGQGRGVMLGYGDIVWAQLRSSPAATAYIFVPDAAPGKHCWTMNLEEQHLGTESRNCFSSPLK